MVSIVILQKRKKNYYLKYLLTEKITIINWLWNTLLPYLFYLNVLSLWEDVVMAAYMFG